MPLGKRLFVLMLLLLTCPVAAEEKPPLKICIDNNFWAPYTFTIHGTPAGLHVEIVTKALDQLAIPYTFSARVWNRCIENAKSGYFDAILSASFAKDRVPYFHFPEDANKVRYSKWRVTQAEYVAVVRVENMLDWNGSELSLPRPVGIPFGYSTVKKFEALGIPVVSSHKYKDLFYMLFKGRIGSMLVQKETADLYMAEETYWKSLRVLGRTYRSASYFLIFSKKYDIPIEQMQTIWDQIAKVRDDKAARQVIDPAVDALLDRCFSRPDICNY